MLTVFKSCLVLGALAAGMLEARAQGQQLADAGKELYDSDCAECHGDDLRNTGGAFDLRELGANERPRFDQSVMNGKGQMPPWKGVLGPAELDQLWAYVRSHAN